MSLLLEMLRNGEEGKRSFPPSSFAYFSFKKSRGG